MKLLPHDNRFLLIVCIKYVSLNHDVNSRSLKVKVYNAKTHNASRTITKPTRNKIVERNKELTTKIQYVLCVYKYTTYTSK